VAARPKRHQRPLLRWLLVCECWLNSD